MRKKKNSNQKTSSKKFDIMCYHDTRINEYVEKKRNTKQNKKDLTLLQKKTIENNKSELNKISNDETDYILKTFTLLDKYSILIDKENDVNTLENELSEIHNQKNKLTNEFLLIIDPEYISNEDTRINIKCNSCNIPYEEMSDSLLCTSCGNTSYTGDISKEMTYKEMKDYTVKPVFTYQKSTHLTDWIRRFTANENRVIDQDILDKVLLEANKQRITDLNQLTEDMVKKFLKRLNLNDYYDNVINIINRLNGRPAFKLSQEIENKLKLMFQQIQEPFNKHKPASRKNFLSYSYILYQLFTILGLEEYRVYFPLLKSIDKLRQQDEIFKKIVEDMAEIDKTVNWIFYPTV